MYKELVKEAKEETLREFLDDAFAMIKETHYDLYEDLVMYLYKEIYGSHFNEWLLDKALCCLINEDGTKGAKWSIDQTTSVAEQNGIVFGEEYNKYDWCYVMNMVYSDYYGAVPNDTIAYFKIAKKFLEDKDAKEGKALYYYLAMK